MRGTRRQTADSNFNNTRRGLEKMMEGYRRNTQNAVARVAAGSERNKWMRIGYCARPNGRKDVPIMTTWTMSSFGSCC